MIKPRRLLLLVLGFFVCFGAYEIYSYFLGHYDGLPPLPPEYRYNANNGQSVLKIDDNENRKHEIAKLLERAFGPKCPELNRYRSVEIGRPENRTVLAFNDWTLEDGVLRLTDPSVAIFKIIPPEGKLPAREDRVDCSGRTRRCEPGFSSSACGRQRSAPTSKRSFWICCTRAASDCPGAWTSSKPRVAPSSSTLPYAVTRA